MCLFDYHKTNVYLIVLGHCTHKQILKLGDPVWLEDGTHAQLERRYWDEDTKQLCFTACKFHSLEGLLSADVEIHCGMFSIRKNAGPLDV